VWVNENKLKGADGIKFFGVAPEIMDAALRKIKLGFAQPAIMRKWMWQRWNVSVCRSPVLLRWNTGRLA